MSSVLIAQEITLPLVSISILFFIHPCYLTFGLHHCGCYLRLLADSIHQLFISSMYVELSVVCMLGMFIVCVTSHPHEISTYLFFTSYTYLLMYIKVVVFCFFSFFSLISENQKMKSSGLQICKKNVRPNRIFKLLLAMHPVS